MVNKLKQARNRPRSVVNNAPGDKKASGLLQLAEDNYRTIFDNSSVAITVVDENENIVRQFVTDLDLTFTIGLGTIEEYNLYDLEGWISPFPVDIIVDKNGIIRYAQPFYDPQRMQDIIEILLEEEESIPQKQNSVLPEKAALNAVYPNPFNSRVRISLELPGNSDVVLQVFDLTGRSVMSLDKGHFPAGRHTINLNSGNLPSGIYFIRAQLDQQVTSTRKICLIR